MTNLHLRRASISCASGSWDHDDFDVFDGDEPVGRIYRLIAAAERWWWGLAFELTGRKAYGTADTLDGAQAAFKAEYENWLGGV